MHRTMTTNPCSDCSGDGVVNRREFLKTTFTGLAAAAVTPLVMPGQVAAASATAAKTRPTSETLVTTFHKSLTEAQRKAICFPFEHPLRSKVDNNWHITEQTLDKFYTRDQQAMIKEIFLGLHSPEYADTVFKQVEHDSGKDGFYGGSSVALFGEPGTGRFEFVLTGRHCTRRCDGDSVEGAAFGGPIFYGHAAKSFN
jgi:hypothetical protein